MVSVPPLFHFLAFLRLRLFEACSKSLQSTHNMLLHSTGADMKFLGRFVICFFLKITQFLSNQLSVTKLTGRMALFLLIVSN